MFNLYNEIKNIGKSKLILRVPVNLFFKSFLGTAGLKLAGRGLAVLSGVIFARSLGVEQYGLYGFALSIITLATLPVVAGLPNLIIREIATFQLKEEWSLLAGIVNWSQLYIYISASLIVVCMCVGLYFSVFNNSVTDLLWILVLLIPLNGLLLRQGAVLNGLRAPVVAQLPVQIFPPLITLFVLFYIMIYEVSLDARLLACVSVLAAFFSVILGAVMLRRIFLSLPHKAVSKYDIKSWHRSLMPFTIITVITTLNAQIAVVFLGWLIGPEAVAYFKIGVQSVALISIALVSINSVTMPDIARYYKQENLERTQELLTKSVRLSVAFSLPIMFLLIFFGEFLIDFLFGSEYLEAYPVLVILCIGQGVNVLTGSVGILLSMTNNERKVLNIMGLTLALTILLLLLFVPLYDYLGAAISITISLIFSNIVMAVYAYKLTNLKPWMK
jgi:O-antigen/teichoic acid export membrane protein